MDLSTNVVVQRHSYLPICLIWACPWAKNLSNQAALGPDLWNLYLWNHWMDLYHSKFYGIVSTCSCATASSIDLDPRFSRSNFENAVSQEWEDRSTWNERDMSRYGIMPTLWPSAMTLTLDFQGQILKLLYLRNGRADWHIAKGMWVDRMLDPHCDFELWPHPWPWPLIVKVIFFKKS